MFEFDRFPPYSQKHKKRERKAGARILISCREKREFNFFNIVFHSVMGLLPLVVGTFVDTVKFGVRTAVNFGTLVAGTELILYVDKTIESVKNPGKFCFVCGRRVRVRPVRGRK